ncbi:hypothetical protein HW115_14325 [Verrucomicrobiaceae bacterium N1E253]|uniref:DUF5703 domain-containing protein n=1 Tax=Oceaniferula marina TaxID=2748318 RepID=A0A851GNU0_9BACT|nr:DUF5703 domain-containing protein [Oceaniferula marina]NWK56795.1 hypothetical protein [Oceaniferula marina]
MTKKLFSLLPCLPLILGGTLSAAPDQNTPNYDVVWDSPSANASGSMPIGNGDIGANVWVEPNGDLLLYISKSDAWGDNGRLLKVGKIRVTCDPAIFKPGDTFNQRLDLQQGCITITSNRPEQQTKLSVWIDANNPNIQIEQNSSQPLKMTAKLELWRTEKKAYPLGQVSDLQEKRSQKNKLAKEVIIEPDTIVPGLTNQVAWYHHNLKSDGFEMSNRLQGLSEYLKEDPILHRTFGGLITSPDGKRVNDTTLVIPPKTNSQLSVTLLTQQPSTPKQWLGKIQGMAQDIQKLTLDQRKKDHLTWWSSFWSRSWIHLATADTSPKRLSPVNQHPVKLGADQAGHNRFDGKVGRVSLIPHALPEDQIRQLAAAKQHTQRAQAKALVSVTNPPLGGTLEGISNKELTGSFTLETWIQAGAGTGRIIDNITPGGSDGFLLDTYPGKSLRLINGNSILKQKDCLTPGTWHHIAVRFDEKNAEIALYLDGKQVDQATLEQTNDARLVSQSYALQRFIDACAGRGKHPIKFNGSLFTVPFKGDPDYRRWGPGFWWQNTRLPYLSMYASGDFDLLQPLFKMYAEDCFQLNKFRTQKYLGHGGAFFSECTYFWGATFTQTYGWQPFEERKDKLQESGWHKWEWVAGPELVFMMLDYFDHTQDDEFLKQKILPLAYEVVQFFDQHYETNKQGELVMHPSMACETWWDCTNPMPEVAGLHAITQRLLSLPTNTLNNEHRAFYRKFQSKLAPLPIRQIGEKSALAPATRFASKRNVENPELYAVFPFRLCSFEKGNAALGLNALQHRWDKGTSGWRQDNLFMTYLGLREESRDYLVKRCKNYDKSCRFPAFWGPNYDWTPDQDHGGVMMKAVQSMIMQPDPYSRKIFLNPALPADWNCTFKLHAPYNTIIEGSIHKGKMKHLKVTPESRRKDILFVDA